MKSIIGFYCVASAFCLSTNAGVAVAAMADQVSNPVSSDQTEPVVVANFFRILQDAVQTIDQVGGVIDSLNQNAPQGNETTQENQGVGDQVEQPTLNQVSAQVNDNKDLYQGLAKKDDESYEVWYDRIDLTTYFTSGEEYRAWRATLSPEDNEAYDAITRQRNYEAREQFDQMIPLIIEGVLQEDEDARQRGREFNCQEYGYCN